MPSHRPGQPLEQERVPGTLAPFRGLWLALQRTGTLPPTVETVASSLRAVGLLKSVSASPHRAYALMSPAGFRVQGSGLRV